jgi:pyruvate/2-oxoglutarate dehydrogenase complex dihydrolipoamide acyltransferase (E2) component
MNSPQPPVPALTLPSGDVQVLLPDIGDGSKVVRLVRFCVRVGERVSSEQPLAEVEYHAATVEIPSPRAGTVKELCSEVDQQLGLRAAILILEPVPEPNS